MFKEGKNKMIANYKKTILFLILGLCFNNSFAQFSREEGIRNLIFSAGRIGGERGAEILQEILKIGELSNDVLSEVAHTAGIIRGERGAEILNHRRIRNLSLDY